MEHKPQLQLSRGCVSRIDQGHKAAPNTVQKNTRILAALTPQGQQAQASLLPSTPIIDFELHKVIEEDC